MNEFLIHVKNGLSQKPKFLSSRYFYDSRGDELFQQIMRLEEYYLPAYEMEIIKNKSKLLAEHISKGISKLHIIELGAGDGSKTKYFIKELRPCFTELSYTALDISSNILVENKIQIEQFVSNVEIEGIAGNYFNTFPLLKSDDSIKLVLFLGANIGNFSIENAIDFFSFIRNNLSHQDYFLVAFDLIKHPRKIINAYDDAKGITKAFNLNLLERINRELGANFNIDCFDHFPYYNPTNGITASHLISLKRQTVTLPDETIFHFEPFEAIHTEISKKFFISDIENIAQNANFSIQHHYYNDTKGYVFTLFKPILNN